MKRTPPILTMLALGLVLVSGASLGQDVRRAEAARGMGTTFNPPPAAPTSPYSASALERSGMSSVPVDPNHRLGPNDMVTVQILEDHDQPALKKISPTGELDMFPYGRIRAAGKTTSQLESDLKSFLEKDYYYKATVSVGLETVNPVAVIRRVVVTGQVRAPGTIEMAAGEQLRLSEAILRAGNFTQWARKEKVHLFRGGNDQTYDVGRIIEKGLVKDDPILQDGDRINVEKNWFTLKGE